MKTVKNGETVNGKNWGRKRKQNKTLRPHDANNDIRLSSIEGGGNKTAITGDKTNSICEDKLTMIRRMKKNGMTIVGFHCQQKKGRWLTDANSNLKQNMKENMKRKEKKADREMCFVGDRIE